ncbi:MAG: hypothetical protein AMJ54_09165 [Deltaproteobacteria bacterium SG8_13]|nr:MAG: hypothetical protein AMJ54_09165 [Deltaproteobacteria bacterium SG8_13]
MSAILSDKSASGTDTAPAGPDRDHGGRGRLFVVSAPSGAGKTTLCRAVLARIPKLQYSVSYTTRRPRSGERDGVAYHFISREEFIRGIDTGRWAEWAKVHGHCYGTSAEFIDRQLASGYDILLDIDVQGAMQIRKRYADCVSIFIMPPSRQELAARLRRRGADSRAEIKRRLTNAEAEMDCRDQYRHVLINDRLEVAIEELVALIISYRREATSARR